MRLILQRFLFASLALAVLASLLSAQHSASHGGGHAGVSSGFSGSHSSGSAFHATSPHYGSSSAHYGNAGVGSFGLTRPNSLLPPPASGISPLAWSQIQKSNRFGYRRLPYGYFFAPYYYPFLGYGDTFASYPDYGYGLPEDAAAQNMLMAQGSLSQQVQALSDQVSQLQDAQQRGAVAPGDAPQRAAEIPITVVLHTGQQIQVQNYAVMGQTFWDFTRQPARKIPISTIDISASTRATEATGGEFPQLTATP